MERLDLSIRPEHSTQESTIHLARYACILPFVKDKVVLDIACGEGYGSALMMRAGAKRVVGVDISAEAVFKSQKIFADSKAEYVQADAMHLGELFEPNTFDVVVSIETIEHVTNVEAYLTALKRVANFDAIFMISCPNDYWYYPQADQANPFHQRKYRFEEFQSVSTKVLGDNVHWGGGSAIFGFGATPLKKGELSYLYKSWMKVSQVGASFVIENDEFEPLNVHNCSYFLGIWNVRQFSYGGAYFGVGMNAYARMFDALTDRLIGEEDFSLNEEKEIASEMNYKNLQKEVVRLNRELEWSSNKLNQLNQSLEKEKKDFYNKNLLFLAVQSENKAIRENVSGFLVKICELEKKVEESRVDASFLEATVKGLEVECSALKMEIKELKERNSFLATKNEDLQVKCSFLEGMVADMHTGYWRYRRIAEKIPESIRSAIIKCVRALKK